MATRAVLQAFERYQKERVSFVSTVAEMAKSPQVRRKRSCTELSWLLLPCAAAMEVGTMCTITACCPTAFTEP
jgi:hypothetical protein